MSALGLSRAGAGADAKAATVAATAINAFAGDLIRTVTANDPVAKGNLFCSPFSIETALAMTSAGARGDTLTEMEKSLRLPKDPHPAFGELLSRLNEPDQNKKREYELSVANAIWAQDDYPWNKDFAELTRKHYGSGLTPINFREIENARKTINAWVEKETKEKIKNLIPEGVIVPLTRMVLCNAVYFKSNWLFQFDKKQTKDVPFTTADGKKVNVPLMTQTANFQYAETTLGGRDGVAAQVLELPYTDKELSMFVVLPHAKYTTDDVFAKLDFDSLGKLPLAKTEVNVSLPRFKLESTLSLKPVLMKMGMKLAFGNADFTGMSPNGRELYISHVLHKAFVDVNEEGTEAAAATAVVIKGRSARPPMPVFRADRPFVFVIRDNVTGTALFAGRYTNPA